MAKRAKAKAVADPMTKAELPVDVTSLAEPKPFDFFWTAPPCVMPRLSLLPGPRRPDCCQNCERTTFAGDMIQIWVECDERDLPTPILIALCEECSKDLVPPHKRLYKPVGKHDPQPGVMALCRDCIHRRGLMCRHSARQCNGGPGLTRTIKAPAHLNYGGGKGGLLYWEDATACSGRETIEIERPEVGKEER